MNDDELADRLRAYAGTLERHSTARAERAALLHADLADAPEIELHGAAGPDRNRLVVVAVAAAVVLVAALVPLVLRRHDTTPGLGGEDAPVGTVTGTSPSTATTVVLPPGAIRVPPPTGDGAASPWDAGPLASTLTGWFDVGDALAGRDAAAPTIDGGTLRCLHWADDASTDRPPRCDALHGTARVGYTPGDGRELGVVTRFGAGTDLKAAAWAYADGSVWGYETFSTPPEPTPFTIGSITALAYRNGDHVQLTWRIDDATVVTLDARGIADDALAGLAAAARPVAGPATRPLLYELTAPGARTPLLVGWLKGRRCATLSPDESCVPFGAGDVIVQGAPAPGALPAVAALIATGSTARFDVELTDDGWITPAGDLPTSFGHDAIVYGDDRHLVVGARLVDDAGHVSEQRVADNGATAPTTAAALPSG